MRVGVRVTVLVDEAVEVPEEEAEAEEEGEGEGDDSEVTKQEVILCSLQKGQQESSPLDLIFSEPLSLTLVCPGGTPPETISPDTAVHLSGYFMPLEALPGELGHYGLEHESEDESEEEEEEEAEELDERDLRMLLAQRALQRKRCGALSLWATGLMGAHRAHRKHMLRILRSTVPLGAGCVHQQ